MKKYLVIGNPIEHSLSPKIHNYWLKKNNINAEYHKLSIGPEEVKNVINDVKKDKIFGINVTVPYKQSVITHLDELSLIAKETSSVNTIYKKNGKIFGDNTDVLGFELAIKNFGLSLKNKKALIIGAGGVVPSIIVALKKLGVNKIYLSNRTKSKIDKIKLNFSFIEELNWGNFNDSDIIINATSVGLNEKDNLNIDINKITSTKFFYDVIYNPSKTNFLKKAEKNGHKILNGRTMFLYQAQKAFEIWHNILPEINNELFELLEHD